MRYDVRNHTNVRVWFSKSLTVSQFAASSYTATHEVVSCGCESKDDGQILQ